MKYTEDFLPLRGDRVFYEHVGYNAWVGTCRVISAGGAAEEIVIKRLGYTRSKTVPLRKVSFMYKCPWYLFWQK